MLTKEKDQIGSFIVEPFTRSLPHSLAHSLAHSFLTSNMFSCQVLGHKENHKPELQSKGWRCYRQTCKVSGSGEGGGAADALERCAGVTNVCGKTLDGEDTSCNSSDTLWNMFEKGLSWGVGGWC